MDNTEALRIVSALASGTHPLTGEIFRPDSPYQSPEIIRALYVASRALEGRSGEGRSFEDSSHKGTSSPNGSSSSKQSGSTRPPAIANAGKQWSAEEDKQLLAAFDTGKTLAEISQLHGRTQGGVRARLEKHGRLEPSPATRWTSGRASSSANA